MPRRLFRLAEARFEYWQAKSCLRSGMLVPGLAMLLSALMRDPAAVMYRLAESPYRVWLRYAEKRLARRRKFRSPVGSARADARPAAWMLGHWSKIQGEKAEAMWQQPVDITGREFLTLAPEPTPCKKDGSVLYTWRCQLLANSIAGRRGASLTSGSGSADALGGAPRRSSADAAAARSSPPGLRT